MGLLPHSWCCQVLRKRGDSCGGFLVVDKDTAQQRKLQWAAVLVKSNRRRMPRTLTSGGPIALCDTALVEVPPWLSSVAQSLVAANWRQGDGLRMRHTLKGEWGATSVKKEWHMGHVILLFKE